MTELEAVNTILRYLGEYPVDSIDIQYPTIALIVPAMLEHRLNILQQGWWFNKRSNVVLESADGEVTAPADALVIIPKEPQYLWVGQTVINADGTDLDKDVTVDLVLDIPFTRLPQAAQYAIVYAAAASVYLGDFGADNTSAMLQQNANGYFQALTRQHTLARKYSTRHRSEYSKYLAALRQ